MNVTWVEAAAGPAVDACRVALRALGMRECNAGSENPTDGTPNIRVLPMFGNLDPEA